MKDLKITKSTPPTDAELLEEAAAWGFDSVQEWLDAMTEAHDAANSIQPQIIPTPDHIKEKLIEKISAEVDKT